MRPFAIPHRTSAGMCPVNGIRDLVHWRAGRDWSNEFVHGLGQGGGFAYLRFGLADPPRQVYWGIAGPRQHQYLANLFHAAYVDIENRTFRFTWRKACAAVDAGTPPVLGPLDMYYLPFYSEIHGRRHIPIHYLLLVGYTKESAHLLDTGTEEVVTLSLDALELAWDVGVPGLGKRNRLVVLDIPHELPPTDELVRRAIADQCASMLRPPVSMVGIPAMEKVAREIVGWPDELGREITEACARQLLEYLNSPPDLEGDNLTAGRHIYIAFLTEAAAATGLDLKPAVTRFRASMALIPHLARAIREGRLDLASDLLSQIAGHEKLAFSELETIVGVGTDG